MNPNFSAAPPYSPKSGNSLDDPMIKARLMLAARIAAGLAASDVWSGPNPQDYIARESWAIAGKLILIAETGGC